MGLCKAHITPSKQEQTFLKGVYPLVLSVEADVKDIAVHGKKYPWSKPSSCPHCGCGLWWHGFVLAYFSCLAEAVYLRRLFCPHCQSVHRLKPSGFWPKFQSSIKEIRSSLIHRGSTRRWRPDLPRARQRQWQRRLKRMTAMVLGICFSGAMAEAFDRLIQMGIIPVSGANKSENRRVR